MSKIINKLKNRKGFTLVELIVVIAVLGIIMAIAVPRYLGVQAAAKIEADKTTIGTIAKAAELYFLQEKITATTTIAPITLVPKYLDAVKFNDETSYGIAGADLDITFTATTGAVTITDHTTTTTVYYPEP